MKAETYIFGDFADGYSQYPDNYTHDLFEKIGKSRKSESEIIYHREGSLTYYIYTREVSKINNTFIGLCYIFNDVLIKDLVSIFPIFEDVITNIVVNGELLEFTNEGKLSTKINQLYTHSEELQRISDYLNSKLTSLASKTEKLPPVNFSISASEWKSFSYKDNLEIQSAILKYSNIRISKGENYNTKSLSSYSEKLSILNKEKNAALQIVNQQKQEISELKKKQKNYILVIWLTLFICIGGIICISTINSRNATIQRLSNDIDEKKSIIQEQTKNIEYLNNLTAEQDSIIEQLHVNNGYLTSEVNRISDINKDLNKEIETIQKEKSELNKKLTQTNKDLKTANNTIKLLTEKNNSLTAENTKLKNKKTEPEKYQVYAKTGNKAYYYYKKNYYYNKTGDSEKDYTIVYVYDKINGYGLTEKGYIKLEDLRKAN